MVCGYGASGKVPQSWCPFSGSQRWRSVQMGDMGQSVLRVSKVEMSVFGGRRGGMRLESEKFCWAALGGSWVLDKDALSSS